MALWNQLLQSPPEVIEQVYASYNSHFPVEVRHYLSDWLESRLLMGPAIPDHDPQLEIEASRFLSDLLVELERKANEMMTDDLFTTKYRLLESLKNFRQSFSHNSTQLYCHIRRCLMNEKDILNSLQENAAGQNPELKQIVHALKELKSSVQTNKVENKNIKERCEFFRCQVDAVARNNEEFDMIDAQNSILREWTVKKRSEDQQRIKESLSHLRVMRQGLVENFKSTIESAEGILNKVIGEFLTRFAALAAHSKDLLQTCCEFLADILWNTREQIKMLSKNHIQSNVEGENLHDFLPELFTNVTGLLERLVTNSFIIDKQPPQVIKKDTKFFSSVRLLIGNTLSISMSSPSVSVKIVSEHQARAIQQTNKFTEQSCGELLNSIGHMEYDETTKVSSVNFRNMQVKRIKREKKSSDNVTDEKSALLFQSNFAVGYGDLVFSVWTLSHPIVVIVHASQEPMALATISWDNAFAEPGRQLFSVPDHVSWNRLAEMLNMKFQEMTGRHLTAENLQVLYEKLFNSQVPVDDDFVTWTQFCKDLLHDKRFSFWEWFYAAMKLTKDHLRGPWEEENVIGFINKGTAENLLQNCQSGTFLLRFSDSELGGISIAWVSHGSVLHIQPFKCNDLAARSLPDRLRDFKDLTILYPNKMKMEAFNKYTSVCSQPSNSGYVPTEMQVVLRFSGLSISDSGTMVENGLDSREIMDQFEDLNLLLQNIDDQLSDFL